MEKVAKTEKRYTLKEIFLLIKIIPIVPGGVASLPKYQSIGDKRLKP